MQAYQNVNPSKPVQNEDKEAHMTLGGETESSNPSRLMFSIKMPITNKKNRKKELGVCKILERELRWTACLIRFNFVP